MTVKTAYFRGDIYKNDKNVELQCWPSPIWILRGCVTFYYFFPFNRLQGRVDRMENSIQPLSMKIDFVLLRLDEVFKKRKLKKDDMEKIFEGIIGNSSGTNTV